MQQPPGAMAAGGGSSILSPAARVVLLAAVACTLVGALLFARADGERAAGVERPLGVQPPEPVTAMEQALGVANNTPMLVADPTEPRFVVLANRLDAPDFSCALHVSGDGGRSWVPANPVPELPRGAEKCYAPEVAFNDDGTLHYLFVGLHGGGNEPMGAFLTTSRDRGQSFSRPRMILGPLSFSVRMAVDPTRGPSGRLHVVWLQATSDPPLGGFGPPPNPILSFYSDDGGRSFSRPTQVSEPGRDRVVAPAVALGRDGAVHVAYLDLRDDVRDYQGLEGPVWEGTWELVHVTSTDGGRRFGRTVVVDGRVVPAERVILIFTMPPPAMVVHGGRVCLSWTDARNGDADALLRCSPDRGSTWERAQRLNDDRAANGKVQYLPRLAVAPDGRLDAIFYDRRRDPENVLNDVYFTFSGDGGKRFAANTRITSDSFESRIGQQYTNPSARGLVEFGSRLGLLSQRREAIAAWADTTNSRLLTGQTGQDVFTAAIRLGSGAATRRSRVVPGVLVGGGVLTTATVVWRTARQRRDVNGS